jgi:hypothetical protein
MEKIAEKKAGALRHVTADAVPRLALHSGWSFARIRAHGQHRDPPSHERQKALLAGGRHRAREKFKGRLPWGLGLIASPEKARRNPNLKGAPHTDMLQLQLSTVGASLASARSSEGA